MLFSLVEMLTFSSLAAIGHNLARTKMTEKTKIKLRTG